MTGETGRRQARLVGFGAADLLDGFDIADEESRDFLGSLVASGRVPGDAMAELADLALMRGQEEWDMTMACAASLRARVDPASRDRGLLLGGLRALLSGRGEVVWQHVVPGSGTADGGGLGARGKEVPVANAKRTRKPARNLSRFWGEGAEGPGSCRRLERLTCGIFSNLELDPTAQVADKDGQAEDKQEDEASTDGLPGAKTEQRQDGFTVGEPVFHMLGDITETAKLRPQTNAKSPFFTTPARSPPTSPRTNKTRPQAGTVSSLPVPPLSAPRFGLIQEEFAHDPFGLLVAVTFLIKTTGKLAIPTMRAFTARFPDPASLAAADPDVDVIPMIRHLGLATRRCAALQRYARSWMARPPTAAVRYAVKNYPRPGDARDVRAGEEFGPEDGECEEGDQTLTSAARRRRGLGVSWEVGHITQGRYALDSWRIFCRDIMLGRSEDWTGGGGCRDGFQPEWMRVLPKDKELRACLRWMWMKEGWAWDPETGDREVLGKQTKGCS